MGSDARELIILNEIAAALNREINLDQALHTTLAQVAQLCDLQTAWIWLINEQTNEPYLAVTQHLPPALANKPQRMKGTTYCYCLDTYQRGDLNGAANIKLVTCTRLDGLVDGTDGLRYHASVPLYAHGKKLGLLNVASKDWRRLSQEDLRLLYIIGDLLSMAIERGRLFQHSVEISATEERQRIAREIHDTLAQGLTAIALQLETADALLEASADQECVQAAVKQALTLTRQSLDETRRSVQNLRPGSLEGRTLVDALRTLAEEYAARWELTLTFNSEVLHPIPPQIEAALYRIAQETLTNVVRHAQARHFHLNLAATSQQITLTISDDGKGFDPNAIPVERYGLVGINERVKLLGGILTIESAPDKGTSVKVTVDL